MTKQFIFYFRNGGLKYSTEIYKNQPGRIEDYEPGRSSIAEKEAKEVRTRTRTLSLAIRD